MKKGQKKRLYISLAMIITIIIILAIGFLMIYYNPLKEKSSEEIKEVISKETVTGKDKEMVIGTNGKEIVCTKDYVPVCSENGITYTNICLLKAAGEEFAYEGVCRTVTEPEVTPGTTPSPTATCTDSDALDIYTAGITKKVGSRSDDYCSNSTLVVEFYCSGDSILSQQFTCPSGYACDGGRCTAGHAPVTTTASCQDTDGGDNIFLFGKTSTDTESRLDSCSGAAGGIEYFCSGTIIASHTFTCPANYTCSGGACAASAAPPPAPPPPPAGTCTDTDTPEMNVWTAGTTTNGTVTQSDRCTNATYGIEYYCSGNSVEAGYFDCSRIDAVCSEGRCAPASPAGCPSGQTSCSGTCVDLTTNLNNCGSCRNVCAAAPHYTPSCSLGTCAGTCEAGYGNCDGLAGNGCEIAFANNNANCGSCGHACSYGQTCISGTCLATTTSCTDTDGGRDVLIGGTATFGGTSATDHCIREGDTVIWEAYCSGPYVYEQEMACPAGYMCTTPASGRSKCVPACNDTDGGIYPLIAGTASTYGGGISATDHCIREGDSVVWEAYCSGLSVYEQEVACPTGYSCRTTASGGACTR